VSPVTVFERIWLCCEHKSRHVLVLTTAFRPLPVSAGLESSLKDSDQFATTTPTRLMTYQPRSIKKPLLPCHSQTMGFRRSTSRHLSYLAHRLRLRTTQTAEEASIIARWRYLCPRVTPNVYTPTLTSPRQASGPVISTGSYLQQHSHSSSLA
jgi:hypothetical protein